MVQDLLNTFIEEHNDLYNKMRKCGHSDTNKVNVYHMEGDIWTHTMMVLQKVIEKFGEDKVLLLSALCHDLGKTQTGYYNAEKDRKSFTGHEAVSTFMATEVLKSYDVNDEERERILNIVAHHGSLYGYFHDNNIKEKYYNKIADMFRFETLLDLYKFYQCDHEGRIATVIDNAPIYEAFNKILEICYKKQIEEIKTETPEYDAEITVLVGPPRAGKSTWTSKHLGNAVHVSRDDLVMQFGKGDTYSDKWNSLDDEDQKFIDKTLHARFFEAKKAKNNIVVDMTNMSKKSRRKWINDLKGYKKKAVVFLTSSQTLMSRNTKDKFIPEMVITGMMQRFCMPDYTEFDEIEVIVN